ESYFDVVASSAIVRARSFGAVAGMVDAGVATYRYVSVLDERTSDVCRHLHGKVWTVEQAVGQAMRVMVADGPEDMKAAAPWPRYADVAELDEDGLAAMGVILPPVHGRCRSTIVAETFEGGGEYVSDTLNVLTSGGRRSGAAVDEKELKKRIEELKADEIVVRRGRKTDALLDQYDAEALFLPHDGVAGEVWFRFEGGVKRSALLEEMMHIENHKRRGFREPTDRESYEEEIQTQHRLLALDPVVSWSDEEREEIEGALEYWEGMLKEYDEAGGDE
ncbi:MAG: hypothetical protein ACPGQD_05655, partial [Planctomycetota bacterium]